MTGRLAVIGGEGFIGQEVVGQALHAGWDVVSLDLADARMATPVPLGRAYDSRRVGITDQDALGRVLSEFRPDAAVNLVAYGAGTDGLARGAASNPARAVSVNIGGLVNVVQALHAAGCHQLVNASSSTVYGPVPPTGERGVTEDAALQPDTIYGATKVGAEHIGRLLGEALDMRVVALRLPLIYGAGRWYGGSQDGLVRFVRALVLGEPARLEAWTETADWMHAPDSAACLLALAEDRSATHPAYNVVGHRSSLWDMGRALVDAAGAGEGAEVVPSTHGVPDLPLMDTTLLESVLDLDITADSAATGARMYVDAARTIHGRDHT